jgi:hypothetical protein
MYVINSQEAGEQADTYVIINATGVELTNVRNYVTEMVSPGGYLAHFCSAPRISPHSEMQQNTALIHLLKHLKCQSTHVGESALD